jgi:hypothetical protein
MTLSINLKNLFIAETVANELRNLKSPELPDVEAYNKYSHLHHIPADTTEIAFNDALAKDITENDAFK